MEIQNCSMRMDDINLSESNIKRHLIRFLEIQGFAIVGEDQAPCKAHLTVISKTGRKEIIKVWNRDVDGPKSNRAVSTYRNGKAQAHTLFRESLMGAFLSFGRQFLGERTTFAVGIPDTKHHRLMIERLQTYFTENSISCKVYLVDHYGTVSVLNLNELIISGQN